MYQLKPDFMKSAIIISLLAFGMNATTKAQCPINDIFVTRDLQTIATIIDNNTDCIKQALAYNPDYANFKIYLDYLYNTSNPWVYHTNPEKEKLFTEFYSKWGKDYPTLLSKAPASDEFYKAINEMVATDPEFFAQNKPTKIPLKYKEWLYVKDLNRKYGVQTVIHAENAAAKIANLPA
ncbi:MAG: hypothetical protein JWQ06_1375, partial [Mucilaginibacter sp.]|nr:hypothetical protein [Mucilaginibacter sp.]